jgi:hypothetical protein
MYSRHSALPIKGGWGLLPVEFQASQTANFLLPTMSPGKLLSEPTFTLTPVEKSPEEKYNYGAVITGLDLNDIDGKVSLPQ